MSRWRIDWRYVKPSYVTDGGGGGNRCGDNDEKDGSGSDED